MTAPDPAARSPRCPDCGYLRDTLGHLWACQAPLMAAIGRPVAIEKREAT